jgi:hypothetical protein
MGDTCGILFQQSEQLQFTYCTYCIRRNMLYLNIRRNVLFLNIRGDMLFLNIRGDMLFLNMGEECALPEY